MFVTGIMKTNKKRLVKTLQTTPGLVVDSKSKIICTHTGSQFDLCNEINAILSQKQPNSVIAAGSSARLENKIYVAGGPFTVDTSREGLFKIWEMETGARPWDESYATNFFKDYTNTFKMQSKPMGAMNMGRRKSVCMIVEEWCESKCANSFDMMFANELYKETLSLILASANGVDKETLKGKAKKLYMETTAGCTESTLNSWEKLLTELNDSEQGISTFTPAMKIQEICNIIKSAHQM